MKKRLLSILCFGVIFGSCVKEAKLEDQLMPSLVHFFEVQLGEDFDRKNDKITITKVDTLTEKGRLLFKTNELQRQLEEEGLPRYERLKDDLAFFTQQNEIDPTRTNQEQLVLVKETCAEFEEDLQALKDQIEETQQKSLTADSLQFMAYRVHGFFTYTSKKEGKQDIHLQVLMNDRFEVIPVEDILAY
ncbi:hypothetical protein [Myroides sp. DW712]|uniref:hypothetical protein n=1 Tax=Myroides sp. DW712 TaxID=3389800 RepID=UPI00397C0E2C